RLNTLATPPSSSHSKALRVAPFGVWCFCFSERACTARLKCCDRQTSRVPGQQPHWTGLDFWTSLFFLARAVTFTHVVWISQVLSFIPSMASVAPMCYQPQPVPESEHPCIS